MEKKESFYKVEEPKEGINFHSEESKKLFLESLQENTANPFFELSDQFTTQTYGSYCGPTNISIILNSMNIDPNKILFRNWRYYNEKNIHACDIESVHEHGMPITDLKYILEKNGVIARLYRPVCDINNFLVKNIDINALFDKKKFKNLFLIEDFLKFPYSTIKTAYLKYAEEKGENIIFFNLINEDFFRICVLASTLYNNFYILCNIYRSQLGQEGGGHYLPVMAYNIKNDLILLFDCARYKYNSRWQKLKIVFDAQTGKDKTTKLSRGFVIAEKPINKKKNIINKDMIYNITMKTILSFIDKIKFENIKDKAYILNWLIINNFEIDEYLLWYERKDLWERIIPELYIEITKFKNFVDFLFMFDRVNFKNILLGCILFL